MSNDCLGIPTPTLLDPRQALDVWQATGQNPLDFLRALGIPFKAETDLAARPIDFTRPLEIVATREPVDHIADDIIQYRGARVCVDPLTGLVFSHPHIGLSIRNTPS